MRRFSLPPIPRFGEAVYAAPHRGAVRHTISEVRRRRGNYVDFLPSYTGAPSWAERYFLSREYILSGFPILICVGVILLRVTISRYVGNNDRFLMRKERAICPIIGNSLGMLRERLCICGV